MSHLIAMLIASSGIALTTAGPNCTLCADKGAEKSADKSSMCCDAGDCKGCQEKKAKAYEAADWPAHNTDLYANDLQGKPLPVALGTETWLSDTVDTEGKVVVLDFWATWCPPCRAASPILDELQKENPDALAVMAIAGQRDPQSDVQSYIDEHPVAYANLYSDSQAVYESFESKGIPLVVVISTDGIIRWIGNPHEEGFLPAVNKTIAADPAIQTRVTAKPAAHSHDG